MGKMRRVPLSVPTGSTFLTVASKLWPTLPTIMVDSLLMSNTKEKLNTPQKRSTSPLPLPNTLPLLNTPLKLKKDPQNYSQHPHPDLLDPDDPFLPFEQKMKHCPIVLSSNFVI